LFFSIKKLIVFKLFFVEKLSKYDDSPEKGDWSADVFFPFLKKKELHSAYRRRVEQEVERANAAYPGLVIMCNP
jgi:hypothetical protein